MFHRIGIQQNWIAHKNGTEVFINYSNSQKYEFDHANSPLKYLTQFLAWLNLPVSEALKIEKGLTLSDQDIPFECNGISSSASWQKTKRDAKLMLVLLSTAVIELISSINY